MGSTIETHPDQQQEQERKTVEQWLREDVTRSYDESIADPSCGAPLKKFFEPLIAQYSK